MKNSTLKHLLLGIITVFILSSCTKNNALLPVTEDKLEGQWIFEEVKFQEGYSPSKTDVTNDYQDFVFDFKNDYSLIRTNTATGQQLEGVWEIDTEWANYAPTTTLFEVLEAWLLDASTGQMDRLNWENLTVRKKKISATEYKDGGTYWYKLIKQ